MDKAKVYNEVFFQFLEISSLNIRIENNSEKDEFASIRQQDQFMYLTDLGSLLERTKQLFGIKRLSLHHLEIPIMGFRFHQKPDVDHLSDEDGCNHFVEDVRSCWSAIRNFIHELICPPGLTCFKVKFLNDK